MPIYSIKSTRTAISIRTIKIQLWRFNSKIAKESKSGEEPSPIATMSLTIQRSFLSRHILLHQASISTYSTAAINDVDALTERACFCCVMT